jgi:hypothetical protein
LTGNLNGNYDIGVTAISNIQYTTDVVYMVSSWPLCIYRISANVTIKNYGEDTVKSFRLNVFSHDFYPTGYRFIGLNKEYQTSIPPGGTVTVATDTFKVMYRPRNSDFSHIQADMCFHTTVPNQSFDINNGNDDFCLNYELEVGLNEMAGKESIFLLSPNPAVDKLEIVSEHWIISFRILDLTGRLLETQLVGSFNAKVNIEDYNTGILVVEVETDKGFFRKKLIVN